MRLPLAVALKSRDATTSKDAKTRNAILEADGERLKMRKRPGMSQGTLIRAGVAQWLGYWNSQVVSVIDDYINVPSALLATTVTTWNASDKGGDVGLTNGDLTATWSTNIAYDAVRSVASKSSGRWYFEVTLGNSASVGIGVANSTDNVDDATAGFTTANAIAYISSTGVIVQNNVTRQTVATSTTNDVIGVLLDKDAGTIAFYKNGVALGTADSNLPMGALYAYATANSALPVITANFGLSAFANAPTSSSTYLNPTTADLQFSGQDNGADAPEKFLMVKNAQQAWAVSSATGVEAITDVDFPGTYAVTLTSLTRSGTTATATTATDTNFQVGSTVVIAGATPSDYNGSKVITGITPSTSTASDPVTITITRSGTTATATSTLAPHGFTNGQSITISGADQAAYNGTFTIAWVSATVFTFTVTVTNNATTPATGSPVLGDDPRDVQIILANTGVDTYQGQYTGQNYNWQTGDTLVISGFATAVFNGAFVISNAASSGPGSGTFDVTITGSGSGSSPAGWGGNFVRSPSATISSITNDGLGTATVTTSGAHGYLTGAPVTISGATQSAYNGTFTVTVTGSTTFTYALRSGGDEPESPATGDITAQLITLTGSTFTFTQTGAPSTPATGTITATGGRNTVPGIVYMDGYFVVMDVNGVIYNSAVDDPTTWNALEYRTANAASGVGKALARVLTYIVAFKEYSTELFFTDPGNATGSPFSPVPSLFSQVGCASGASVADVGGNLLWISQSKAQKGRSVHMMVGTQQVKVSTPDIERILNADSLATVKSYGVSLDGHPVYVLTLVVSGITLVFDPESKVWGEWTSLTIAGNQSISSITRSGTTATVTFGSAHGLSDGDPLKISGANQSDYNGIFQVSYVSTTVVTIEVANSPVTPATGTLIGNAYTASYFKFSHYANSGSDVLLHESDGYLYTLSSSLYQDNAQPVDYFARTDRMDGGDLRVKKNPRTGLIANSLSDTAMIRWSDNDCSTYDAYRRVSLASEEPALLRCGSFKRRTYEFRHVGNTAPIVEALELEIT